MLPTYCCDEWALGWIDLLYTLQMAMIFTHVIDNLCILINRNLLDSLSYDYAKLLVGFGAINYCT